MVALYLTTVLLKPRSGLEAGTKMPVPASLLAIGLDWTIEVVDGPLKTVEGLDIWLVLGTDRLESEVRD